MRITSTVLPWMMFALIGVLVAISSLGFECTMYVLQWCVRTGVRYIPENIWIQAIVFIVSCVACVLLSAWMVKRWAPKASGSGIPEVEAFLLESRPFSENKTWLVKWFASPFSLASGLLLGREGPMIHMGAMLAKYVTSWSVRLTAYTHQFVVCGAAAGLTCAFDAPFSGVMFALEELRDMWRISWQGIAALLFTCGLVFEIRRVFLGTHSIFELPGAIQEFWYMTPCFVFLGFYIACGAWIYYQGLLKVFFWPGRKKHAISFAVMMGLVVGILGFMFPISIGAGYELIEKALLGHFTLWSILVLVVLRCILSCLSYGVLVPGGIFFPMLSLGVLMGTGLGQGLSSWLMYSAIHPTVWGLAGMGGFFAAVVGAPMTATLLVIEMTHQYDIWFYVWLTSYTAHRCLRAWGCAPVYHRLRTGV
ncbi:MAG: chloride channel protein [Legionellaceae bacterium]|nr:chloride channel protein [Legionellaceae bacterium]